MTRFPTRATSLLLSVILSLAFVGSSAFSQQKDPVLADGSPRLTQSMIDRSIEMLEWSLGSRFASADRSKIEHIIVIAWRTDNRAQIKSVLDVIEISESIRKMPEAERTAIKEKLRPSLLHALSREPRDELSAAVMDAHDRSRSAGDVVPKAPNDANVNPPPPPRGTVPANTTGPIWRIDRPGLLTYSARSSPATEEQIIRRLQQIALVKASSAATPVPSFDEALAGARAFLIERARPEALAAFNASPQAKTANWAALAAGGALVAKKPLAALAVLLRAHQLEPSEPTHLANLAAVLSLIGMPAETLAILDSPLVKNGRIASPLGMGGSAGALTTRGHALIQLGRTGEAETVLRNAVALSPGLKEASSNLAFSLWLQDDPRKKDEAARLIAGVWRRTPRTPPESVPPEKVPPAEVERTPPQEIPMEIFETGTVGLDMSGGKRLTLPDLKIPGSLEASVAMHPVYGKLIRELQTRLEQLSERGEEYQQKVEAKSGTMRVPTAPELKAMRALASIEHVKAQPSVRPLWEKAKKSFLNSYQGVDFRGTPYSTSEMFDERPAGVAERGSQSGQLMKLHETTFRPEEAEFLAACANSRDRSCGNWIRSKYHVKRCQFTRQAHAAWRSGIHDYDTALRNYLEAAYKHMTALLANIRDRDQYEVFRTEIESHIYNEWLIHIQAVDSIFDASNKPCPSGVEARAEEINGVVAERPDFCPAFLAGGKKIKIDLKLISLSAGCETLGVELSSPWLGLFVEGEANFKGGWISKYQGVTIGAGVKGGLDIDTLPEGLGIGGIAVEGKLGGYVKLDKDGNLKDAGFKVGATMTLGREENPFGPDSDYTSILGAGESGLDYEVTILPALGFPPPD